MPKISCPTSNLSEIQSTKKKQQSKKIKNRILYGCILYWSVLILMAILSRIFPQVPTNLTTALYKVIKISAIIFGGIILIIYLFFDRIGHLEYRQTCGLHQ